MYIVEKTWHHKGIPCSVLFTMLGHRCGYIAIPASWEVPWACFDEDNPDIGGYCNLGVHGGVTLDDNIKYTMGARMRHSGIMLGGETRVLGFDCAHAWDNPDTVRAEKLFNVGTYIRGLSTKEGTARSLGYCVLECHNMVEQLLPING